MKSAHDNKVNKLFGILAESIGEIDVSLNVNLQAIIQADDAIYISNFFTQQLYKQDGQNLENVSQV